MAKKKETPKETPVAHVIDPAELRRVIDVRRAAERTLVRKESTKEQRDRAQAHIEYCEPILELHGAKV